MLADVVLPGNWACQFGALYFGSNSFAAIVAAFRRFGLLWM